MTMVTADRVMGTVWLVWIVSWLAAAAWSDRAAKRPTVAREIVYRVVTIAGVVLLFGFYDPGGTLSAPRWRPPAAVGWACVGMSVAGLAFTWWARIFLGRLWSSSVTRKSNHRVIDTGPYGIVRHPIYTGVIAAVLATAAIRGTAAAWLGAVIVITGLYIKARLEEAFLRQELEAAAYDAYARRVPMLIPFVRGFAR